jgi:hypothetical protein
MQKAGLAAHPGSKVFKTLGVVVERRLLVEFCDADQHCRLRKLE